MDILIFAGCYIVIGFIGASIDTHIERNSDSFIGILLFWPVFVFEALITGAAILPLMFLFDPWTNFLIGANKKS